MIEGLRAAPWFHEMSRRGQLGIDDCGRCMKQLDTRQRQSLGCGYLPPLKDKTRLTIWQPPGGEAGYGGPDMTVCAGFTVNLPQVIETSIARLHWKNGELATMLGEAACEDLLNSILILEGQCNSLESWRMTPARDGGGGK